MKRKYLTLFSLLLSFILIGTIFIGCKKDTKTPVTDKPIVKVKLNEVTRSIFYAPFYAAMNQGFFKEEGLNIDLTTGEGADATYSKTQLFTRTLHILI